jgi:hypothetical protein
VSATRRAFSAASFSFCPVMSSNRFLEAASSPSRRSASAFIELNFLFDTHDDASRTTNTATISFFIFMRRFSAAAPDFQTRAALRAYFATKIQNYLQCARRLFR